MAGELRLAPVPGQEEAVEVAEAAAGGPLEPLPCAASAPARPSALTGATTRLLTTVRTPSIVALSAAAKAREASLSTLPSRVATPLATLTWMFWPFNADSAPILA